jgi:hypothetical protein
MRIISSDIAMESARTFLQKDETKDTLRLWTAGRRDVPTNFNSHHPQGRKDDKVTISGAARSMDTETSHSPKKTDAPDALTPVVEDSEQGMDSRLLLLKRILERFLGKTIKIFDMPEPALQDGSRAIQSTSAQEQTSVAEGWGLEYNNSETHYESESLSFSAQGSIQTADGKTIDFSLNLELTRESLTEETLSLRAGDAAKAVDPLVINFEGSSAELTDMKFSFDLNSDGSMEKISFLKPGSGFLTLDINGDSKINDGKELFGPETGNGFSELAEYDADGNGWIDEGDPVYERLSVWTKDTNGADHLAGLKESGVGAIYLAAVASKFDLKDDADLLQGQLSRSGIYVGEDGSVKTIQQVDLVV